MSATHEVTNQVPPLVGHDPIAGDAALAEACVRHADVATLESLKALGALAGSEQAQEWGRLANENPPRLRTHDRYGHRIDEVEFHPAWHDLMRTACETGLAGARWAAEERHPHVRRAVGYLGWTQVEMGHGCPVTMTYAVVPALRRAPELAARYEPGLTATAYDFGLAEPAGKRGLVAGMGMTEKQGGSDVRANTTRAVARPDGSYGLTGHKWFTSAPMSDLFLVLAQLEEGVSCFLVPRVLPDGTRNVVRLQRLKDKLGDRSNASSEVEFEGTSGWLVGEPGRGVPAIIEMVNMTRLDCVLGSAATVRAALTQAVHHARHRRAFGAVLADQPLMQNVLADLAIESEAATISALWLARQFDQAHAGDEASRLVRRIATPVLKYWTCKRAPAHAVEALECFGGNGYVEDSGMPRLFRESPLQSIWEGSGNVQCLDVLRAMVRNPASVEAFAAEVGKGAVAEPRLDRFGRRLRDDLASHPETLETRARSLVERMALALQASLLVRFGDPAVADAFCASRLDGDWGRAFGTLPAGLDYERIIERHRPLR